MTSKTRPRPQITVEFEMPEGGTAKRSLLDDFRTLRARIFIRIERTVGNEVGNRAVIPGINAYNTAEYEDALSHFSEATREFTQLIDELDPHIRICRRVVSAEKSPEDRAYLDKVKKWEKTSRLVKLFSKAPVLKVRCKHCGHFTPYIDPNQGFAYLDTNNCQVCGRGYPAPDFAWDGVDGQAYIYYRHSVTEPQFYSEFEEQYDVHPDHTFFLAKNE